MAETKEFIATCRECPDNSNTVAEGKASKLLKDTTTHTAATGHTKVYAARLFRS